MTSTRLTVPMDFAYAVQLTVGFVFFLAAVSKVRHSSTFKRTLALYGLLPDAATGPAAWLIIVLEPLLAAAFFTGMLLRLAAPAAVVVLGTFSVGVGLSIRRGNRVPCGCFGGESELVSISSLFRLAALIAGVTLIMVTYPSGVSVVTLYKHGVSALGYVLEVAGVGVVLTLIGVWLLNSAELRFMLRNIPRSRVAST
jgi:Methylamine utilisation protein MauE